MVGLAKEPTLDASWSGVLRGATGSTCGLQSPTREEVPVYGFPDGPDFVFRAISEAVDRAIPADADVVYFQDWGGSSLIPLRTRAPVEALRAACVRHRRSRGPRSGFATAAAWRPTIRSRTRASVSPSATRSSVRLPRDALALLPRLARRRRRPRARAEPRDRLSVVSGRAESAEPLAPPAADTLPAARLLRPPGDAEGLRPLPRCAALAARARVTGTRRASSASCSSGRSAPTGCWSRDAAEAELAASGVQSPFVADLDTWSAHRFLADNAGDALVVVPSLLENFPYPSSRPRSCPGSSSSARASAGFRRSSGRRLPTLTFVPTPLALADALERRLGRRAGTSRPDSRVRLARRQRPLARAARGGSRHSHGRRRRGARRSRTSTSASRTITSGVICPRPSSRLPHRRATGSRSRSSTPARRIRSRSRCSRRCARCRAARLALRGAGARRPGLGAQCRRLARRRALRVLRRRGRRRGAATRRAPSRRDRGVRASTASPATRSSSTATAWPLDEAGELRASPRQLIKPLGGSAASAILYNPYSLPYSVMRRETFDRLGGYREDLVLGRLRSSTCALR